MRCALKLTKNIRYFSTNPDKFCINCKHFIKVNNYHQEYGYINEVGLCKVGSKRNLVTGDTDYNPAFKNRHDENVCGKNGKYSHNKYDVK